MAKKGKMTPGVPRQYCGSMGKVDYCCEVPSNFKCRPTYPTYDSMSNSINSNDRRRFYVVRSP